jgi:hypothetical protein
MERKAGWHHKVTKLFLVLWILTHNILELDNIHTHATAWAKMATPTPAKDIAPSSSSSSNRLDRTVSHSITVSTSPSATFHSPPASFGTPHLTRAITAATKQLKPFDTQDIKILLLENVNQGGRDILAAQGYQVEALKSSLPEDQLIEKIRWGKSTPQPLRTLHHVLG